MLGELADILCHFLLLLRPLVGPSPEHSFNLFLLCLSASHFGEADICAQPMSLG